MKKTILASSISMALILGVSTPAKADFPVVVIDSDIILNYGETIDLTGAVSIPTVEIDAEADISINQFNHGSPVTAVANVINNTPTGVDGQAITDLQVNVSAIGNNASVELDYDNTVIGSVQGNQAGGATAVGNITGNHVDLDDVVNEDGETVAGIVELNVTAVGNNLNIAAAKDTEVWGTKLGSLQFNYESPVTATGSIVRNGFGVDPIPAPVPVRPVHRDPKLTVSAIGNNLAALAGTTGSLTQISRNSPITATGLITQNTGFIGPVVLNVTAVGNNILIRNPEVN